MALQCGIVGLPNVGKSTLFNAMTKTQVAEAANYPFCTIEPNVAKVSTWDPRLEQIAKIAGSAQLIHNKLNVVDIAGLVKGASKGEGLGNKFLSHIREVDVIIHVLRCFENDDIKHIHLNVDPIYDAQTVEMELILADIQSVENKIKKEKNDKDLQNKLKMLLTLLENGDMAKNAYFIDAYQLNQLQLLTTKPILYVCNVEEENLTIGNEYSKKVKEYAEKNKCGMVIVSAAIEQEISTLESKEEIEAFLKDLGLEHGGSGYIAASCANLLNLITFFTAGEKEARAWPITKGATAPQAAGVIHTEFEKKFIKAETISFSDYIEYGGEKNSRGAGKLRLEGRDYVVQDGDVMHFKHG